MRVYTKKNCQKLNAFRIGILSVADPDPTKNFKLSISYGDIFVLGFRENYLKNDVEILKGSVQKRGLCSNLRLTLHIKFVRVLVKFPLFRHKTKEKMFSLLRLD